jgi:CRISPR/Cas system CSM-associated protein Csm3 (group 7 of RAMP superfamily)
MAEFINPYNFVQFSERKDFPLGLQEKKPVGHGCYFEDKYHGQIDVEITTITPLLINDHENLDSVDNHNEFLVRKLNGKAFIHSRSFKGMLRSAFEAVTNSRMGVFEGADSAEFTDCSCTPKGLAKKDAMLPPEKEEEFTPADRVFGVVNKVGNKEIKYAGHLRFEPVECKTEDSIKPAGGAAGGIHIANLNSPHPSYYPFYVKGGSKYEEGNHLRGRKVYPHHKGLEAGFFKAPDNYIKDDSHQNPEEIPEGDYSVGTFALVDENVAGGKKRYPDFLHIGKPTASSFVVKEWVPVDVRFTTTIHFDNLNASELQALCYLLHMPDAECYHRLGGGKPLGFGSVRIDITNAKIYGNAKGMKQRYETLLKDDLPAEQFMAVNTAKKLGTDYIAKAANISELKKILDIWECVCKGFDEAPIQYPRVHENEEPVRAHSDGYAWFVEDKKNQKLPDLSESASPVLKTKPRSANQGHQQDNSLNKKSSKNTASKGAKEKADSGLGKCCVEGCNLPPMSGTNSKGKPYKMCEKHLKEHQDKTGNNK